MCHIVYSIAYCRGVCLCLPVCHCVKAGGVWPQVHTCMYVFRAQDLLIVGLRWWWCVFLFAVWASSTGPQGVDQCSSMIGQFWMSEGPVNWIWDGDTRDICRLMTCITVFVCFVWYVCCKKLYTVCPICFPVWCRWLAYLPFTQDTWVRVSVPEDYVLTYFYTETWAMSEF